jgi:hypothetical protein
VKHKILDERCIGVQVKSAISSMSNSGFRDLSCDPIADFILDAQPELAKVLTGSEITALSTLVSNFDFNGALKCVSDIAARLTLPLE